MSGEPIIHDIYVNKLPHRPYDPDSQEHRSLEIYVAIKEQVCYDYRSPPEHHTLYAEAQESMMEHPLRKFQEAVETKNGPLMLEHVLWYGHGG